MNHSFKVGDRCAIYDYSGRCVGEVTETGANGLIAVKLKSGATHWFHHKQCRKLKPREKSVRVTRNQLREAWISNAGAPAILDKFAKDLGL